jgi:hypothetical protein
MSTVRGDVMPFGGLRCNVGKRRDFMDSAGDEPG